MSHYRMYFTFTLLLTLLTATVGCSAKTTRPYVPFDEKKASATTEQQVQPSGQEEGSPKAVKRKKFEVDRSKPATYAEYKQWRGENDPSGQIYAEYKEWETAYNQWRKQRAKAVSQ